MDIARLSTTAIGLQRLERLGDNSYKAGTAMPRASHRVIANIEDTVSGDEDESRDNEIYKSNDIFNDPNEVNYLSQPYIILGTLWQSQAPGSSGDDLDCSVKINL